MSVCVCMWVGVFGQGTIIPVLGIMWGRGGPQLLELRMTTKLLAPHGWLHWWRRIWNRKSRNFAPRRGWNANGGWGRWWNADVLFILFFINWNRKQLSPSCLILNKSLKRNERWKVWDLVIGGPVLSWTSFWMKAMPRLEFGQIWRGWKHTTEVIHYGQVVRFEHDPTSFSFKMRCKQQTQQYQETYETWNSDRTIVWLFKVFAFLSVWPGMMMDCCYLVSSSLGYEFADCLRIETRPKSQASFVPWFCPVSGKDEISRKGCLVQPAHQSGSD